MRSLRSEFDKRRAYISPLTVALLLTSLLVVLPTLRTSTAVTTITAVSTTSTIPINGVVQPGEWTAQPINIAAAGINATFEQNSTGLLFLLQWNTGSSCSDEYCFGGIEIGPLNNTGEMGTSQTPTIMILLSPSFTNSYDEFVSESDTTPSSVESLGYATQSICALKLAGTDSSGSYTAECYRPFALHDATPYDPFPILASGSPIEIAFAVGEFNEPGDHLATDMSTYVLTLSSPPTTVSTSSTSSAISTLSTTTSSTSSIYTTSSSAVTTTSTSSTSTTSSSATSTMTSSTFSTRTLPACSSSVVAGGTPGNSLTIQTNSQSYFGSQRGTISGSVTGNANGNSLVEVQIVSPYGSQVFSSTLGLTSSNSFNTAFETGTSDNWVSGQYTLSASWSTLNVVCGFSYSPTGTSSSSTTTNSTLTSSTSISTTTLSTSSSSSTSSSTSTSHTTTTSSTKAKTSNLANYYAEILIVIIVGFSVLMAIVARRYKQG